MADGDLSAAPPQSPMASMADGDSAASVPRKPPAPIVFAQMHSAVEQGFWRRLSSLKLDQLGLDQSPIPITGFFAPCTNPQVSTYLTLFAESFSLDMNESSMQLASGNRNKCPVPGIVYNTNTLESFHALDREGLLKSEAKKIWDDIHSGRAEKDSSLLMRFLLIAFADLKNWSYRYWFAFPALKLSPPATLIYLGPALGWFSRAEGESVAAACNGWRSTRSTGEVPFFLLSISNSHATIRPLKDWKICEEETGKLLFGFYDPCHVTTNPGWPLRNFLALIFSRWKLEKVFFFCYREKHGFADLGLSLVGEALISASEEWRNPSYVPNAVGWEYNQRKAESRYISLAASMDPARLAESAAGLNLKLMRWRSFPSLDLSVLFNVKCLLLGAGTLGCEVARMLMAWGVRKITLLDSGRVAMSNPVRQSLYTFENCLNGGDLKADAAVKSLKNIFPAVEAEGITMAIPMPGHPVTAQETAQIVDDCVHLEKMIESHDVIFLLTDTRESRWLPTLFCANFNKIAITAALGFESYLVMRHGHGPQGGEAAPEEILQLGALSVMDVHKPHRLGCYFCSDVVAPTDSTSNRTLDQQCTVTRPGLALIASALAVELLVGILHHPDRINAPGEISNSVGGSSEQPLGILPHQIRGSLSQFSQLTLLGHSSSSCTACSNKVISEYRKRGMEFLLRVINQPTYLEDITGITDLKESANSFELEWVDEDDDLED